MTEVEAIVEAYRHDGGRGVRRSLAGEHCHLALVIHAHGVITGWEWIDLVEVVAFHPVLQFTGGIAGVCALLEHSHHNDFYRDRAWLRGGHVRNGRKQEKGREIPLNRRAVATLTSWA